MCALQPAEPTRATTAFARDLAQGRLWHRRHALATAMAAGLLQIASAQERKVWRLAWLSPAEGPGPNHAAFLTRMQDLGYEEGRDVRMEWAWVGPRTERLAQAAANLVGAKPDVLIAQSQLCALAAQNATKSIPTVFVGVRDPVVAGLVKSLSHPGGNITGVTLTPNAELVAKHLELIRALNPKANLIGVFWNPDVPVQAGVVDLITRHAFGIGIKVRAFPVHAEGEIERAFQEMTRDRFDGVLTLVEWFTYSKRALIAKLAIDARIPTLFEIKDYVSAGGLLAYGVIYHEHFAAAAHYVDKILKGAKPSDLPVQLPTRLEMVLNMKTARSMQLAVPRAVLLRADELLE